MASLTAETLIEAIDGPVAVATLEGKSIPVLTRFPDGRIGFRMMGKFAKAPAAVPVVKIVFENGQIVRVGADQVLVKKEGATARAADLRPADGIIPSWDYREGYRPPDLPESRLADGTLQVRSVTPDGDCEVFSAPIRETGVFFLHCGALLQV